MSVEAAQAGVRQAEMKLVEAKFLLEKETLVADSPDAGLAGAIRDAYYNDGVLRLLVDSGDPGQWLRMAAAAREFLAPKVEGVRVPRVFNVGDDEPEDRDTIVLRSRKITSEDGRDPGVEYLEFRYGQHADSGFESILSGWWQVTESHHTRTTWDSWLTSYAPLTEVLEDAPEPAGEAKPDGPRLFTYGDDEPADAKVLLDADGDVWVRNGDRWDCDDHDLRDKFDYIVRAHGPLTEVIE